MLLCLPNVEPGPFPIGDIVLQHMFGDTFLPAGEGQLLPKRVAPARAPPVRKRHAAWSVGRAQLPSARPGSCRTNLDPLGDVLDPFGAPRGA